jgi:hypothetical protein
VLRAHEPYPALVFDRRWNILMTNRAVDRFFAGVAPDLLRPPVNLVWLGLDPRGLASYVVNLADVRAMFRTRVGRQLAAFPDAELTALYEELLAPGADDEPGGSIEPESDVVIPMIIRIDGREPRLFSTITTFGTPMDITLDEGRCRVVLPGARGERGLLHVVRLACSRMIVAPSAALAGMKG